MTETYFDNEDFEKIKNPEKLFSCAELRGSIEKIPDRGGVYAWYFNKKPSKEIDLLKCKFSKYDEKYFLYVGISPSKNKPNSKSTLRTRIKNHIKGSSTLRLSLACLFNTPEKPLTHITKAGYHRLNPDGRKHVNDWLDQHAYVCWIETEKTNELEQGLMKTCNLPLNIQGNKDNEFYKPLRDIRKSVSESAQRK